MIEANGVELCTEPFGDPADPPILLVMGIGGSMLWWEESFCRMLAGGGRFVIRYDHRDTGRSVTYEPGHAEYTGAHLVADAVGVLDAYRIPAAHMVGVSAGGAFAQLLALAFPDRLRSLVLISTSSATPGRRSLPAATERYSRFLASAEVDWSDRASVIEYLVGYARMLAGGERPFEEAAWRELVGRDVERAHDIAASENHGLIADGEVSAAILYDTWEHARDADLELVQQALETNLFGAWRVTQALLPLLAKSAKARIVNVSSGAGSLGSMRGTPAYSVSKAALNALTRLLAFELPQMRVNAVCPGWVATDMGGPGGRPVREGAAGVVWAATLDSDGPTGGFFRDGVQLPW